VPGVEDHGMAVSPVPHFADLFPVCRCGGGTCGRCSGFQMAPRTAAVLWSLAQMLADHGYDDVGEHGSGRCAMRAAGRCSTGTRG